jgi:hypothetical protein
MDSLCEDAVKYLLSLGKRKPALLAEGGAVNANHSGPSSLYPLDKDGIILHDVLFAPFFSGAAGPGHSWHWDHYIGKFNHWNIFGQFSKAVEGVDPAAEGFTPEKLCRDGLRYYCLRGRRTTLVWVRDASNTWEAEFSQGLAPGVVSGRQIPVSQIVPGIKKARTEIFDPWTGVWSKAGKKETVVLPDFKRSIVIRLHY